jgi:tetratricopeptide (TPR) repeat protein
LAERATELDPYNAQYQNTLGVVYYRLGRYQKAIDCLERSLAVNSDSAAHDLFFLAMSYFGAGRPEKARECFDRAISWCQAHPMLPSDLVAELTTFRGEAEAVLKLPMTSERR